MKNNKKKKRIVQTTSLMMAASALVAVTPAQAASQANVEEAVNNAFKLANSLKSLYVLSQDNDFALSKENMTKYNQAKESIQKAQSILSSSQVSNKNKLEAKLKSAEEIRLRVARVIDLTKLRGSLEELQAELNKDIEKQMINDETVNKYNKLSAEIRKTERAIGKMYGSDNRKIANELVITPAKIVRETIIYEVSRYNLLKEIEVLVSNEKFSEVEEQLAMLERLEKRSLDIKEAGNKLHPGKYPSIPQIESSLVHTKDELIKKVPEEPTVDPDAGSETPTTPGTGGDTETPANPGTGGDTETPANPGAGGDTETPATPGTEIPSTITAEGTYGQETGDPLVVEGDLVVKSQNVTLKNMIIKGNLLIAEEVGEGDVTLQGVTVEGTTTVKGGGSNSIHFTDSVLATVIVNKNNGAIRIVASGSTQVYEVQLESYVKIEEENLDNNADGFTNITVGESVQSATEDLSVELIGSFETINSRAMNVRINLDQQTDIRTLVLNAAASVLGAGRIDTAQINANGSTISQRPQNLVLDNGTSVQVGEDEVTDSYSDTDSVLMTNVHADQSSISVEYDEYIAGLTLADFDVTATLDGQPYELQNLEYNSNRNRFTFTPVLLTENLDKELVIKVKPAESSTKVTGQEISSTVEIGTGFSGRITDIANVGIEGMTIKFREGTGTTEGEVVAEVTTDKFGYYSVNLPSGNYTGEFSKQGYVTSYMMGTAPTDTFNVDQNETAIRAAATNELKIMLEWGENPSDLDSHLVATLSNGEEQYHTWYSDKEFVLAGTTYADLDWDDTNSYGPETTTIRKLVDGEYLFYVHNFSGETPLAESGAKVKIFKGNALVAEQEFSVPSSENNERYWEVFKLVVSNDGQDIDVTPINDLLEDTPFENEIDPTEQLQYLINDAQYILNNGTIGTLPGDYTEESFTGLQTALNAALTLLENTDATEEEIMQVSENLSIAIEQVYMNQVPFENENENDEIDQMVAVLVDTINEGQDLVDSATVGTEPGNFTQESLDLLQTALNDARGFLEDGSFTPETILSETQAINDAIEVANDSRIPNDLTPPEINELNYVTPGELNNGELYVNFSEELSGDSALELKEALEGMTEEFGTYGVNVTTDDNQIFIVQFGDDTEGDGGVFDGSFVDTLTINTNEVLIEDVYGNKATSNIVLTAQNIN
ncbi:FIVAR domain-containing protein [Metabacillus halosaccharovorans]|uniref:FIVAR domain-containing protein n=1 Tax=Metabacillus halosaccharovorans TaxID=930124 RepID=UPI00099540AF|nr:FIVAR domain-containing protein [Metabacillus halosaccharovorans]